MRRVIVLCSILELALGGLLVHALLHPLAHSPSSVVMTSDVVCLAILICVLLEDPHLSIRLRELPLLFAMGLSCVTFACVSAYGKKTGADVLLLQFGTVPLFALNGVCSAVFWARRNLVSAHDPEASARHAQEFYEAKFSSFTPKPDLNYQQRSPTYDPRIIVRVHGQDHAASTPSSPQDTSS